MLIVGLHGVKGSGKDTVYKLLKEIDNGYSKIAFADPIKKKIFEIFQIDEHAYDTLKRIPYWRHIFRSIGMLMRSYNDKQFINYIDENLTNKIVVTDVRFIEELNFLKSKNAFLVKIKRFNQNNDDHITEKELDDSLFDYVIHNTEDLYHLREQVIDVNNIINNKE